MGNPVVGAARRIFKWDYQMDPRIAYLSPMPPARTGIATYSKAVLAGLERIGYTKDHHQVEAIWPLKPKHEGALPWYTMGVYHLGNNVEFHRDIYRHAIQTPGLVVLHDLALDDFVRGMIANGDPLGYQAMREGIANAPRLADFEDAVRNEPLRVPYVAHVARRARGILVHSPFVERYLRAFGCRTPVYVAPHPVVESWDAVRRAATHRAAVRGPLEGRGMRTLVGVFGDLNIAKLIDLVLAAVAQLPPSVHVALVGRRIEAHDVDAWVAASGIADRVTLRPDVTDEEFLNWMAAADVAVDLRFPHRGEVSGSLARAMQSGLPTVVSATGTYLDVSDELVVRVPPAAPSRRRSRPCSAVWSTIPSFARASAGPRERTWRRRIASEATAHGYEQAIEETLGLIRNPARTAEARWAGALADIGVDEELLRRGYGQGYARAMDGFRVPLPGGETAVAESPPAGTETS